LFFFLFCTKQGYYRKNKYYDRKIKANNKEEIIIKKIENRNRNRNRNIMNSEISTKRKSTLDKIFTRF